jgi:HK97 family phage major capsid protein
MATYAEQIGAYENKRAANVSAMKSLMDKSAEDGATLDAPAQEEFDNFLADNEAIDKHLTRLRVMEKANLETARPIVVQSVQDGSEVRTPSLYRAPVQVKSIHAPGTGLVRLMAAKWMAKEEGRPAYEIAKERFGDTPEIEMVLRAGLNAQNWVQKTAVTAGSTTDSSWAGPLVVVNNMANEFLEYLRPKTILGRIPGLRMVPFNVSVPRQLTETTGYWVGQGENKPVSSATFDTVTLTFHKLAAIAVITEELARFSSPSAEATVRESLAAAIIYRMDRDLLDPSKAVLTGVNPASLTNGVTPTTATGTTADALRDDLGTMMATYLQNNMSTSGTVLVMTEDQALKLSFMVNTLGQLEFPNLNSSGGNIRGIPVITTQNIVATGGSPTDGYPIIAINAPSILVADEGGVSIDISREASLQMNDSPDSPETTSTISVSLWQHNLLGIKAERFVTWVKGRPQAVQFIQNAKYQ